MKTHPSPDVSVVMSVYNGASSLAATLDSVLSQEDCDFEFIVVNDGSTDHTSDILNEYAARDPRLDVVHQENTGLTRALINGCAAARGEFIARHDCGDTSLPDRLRAQVALLRERNDVVLVSCACRILGPRGEALFEVARDGDALALGLSRLDVSQIQGPPHHGSTMFRRDAYVSVGGYRPQFIVAQDMDLWLRLTEVGNCIGTVDVGYAATLEANSISGRRRDEQIRLGSLAIACAIRRRAVGTDQQLLDEAVAPPKQLAKPMSNREKAKFLYFIGSCLQKRSRSQGRAYFRESFRADPFFLKALLRSVLW